MTTAVYLASASPRRKELLSQLGIEFEQFSAGTKALSQAIAESDAFSIAGGGDTLAAVDKYEIADKISLLFTSFNLATCIS